MNLKSKWLFPVVVIALLALAPSAKATSLPPGSAGVVPNQDSGGWSDVADIVDPFSFAGTTGTVEEAVVRGFTGSPYFGACPTCLSFLYQVNVTTGDIATLGGLSSFAGYLVDVGYSPTVFGTYTLHNGGSVNSLDASRSPSGAAVNFDFSTAGFINPGESSYIEFVNTNSTTYTSGLIGLADGSSSAPLPGFATTPEYGSTLLMGLAFLGVGTLRKKLFA